MAQRRFRPINYPVSSGGSVAWGSITGTLSSQTDLNSALSGKSDTSHTHVEADITDLGTYLTDAPSDGSTYGRNNGAWAVVSGGGAEVNDLSVSVTWANVPDANITETSVTQHEAALSLTESQISDLGSYSLTTHQHPTSDIISGTFADARIAASNVTQHEAALSITESQISDLQTHPSLSADETITGDWRVFTSSPKLGMGDSNAGGNEKNWVIDANSGVWTLATASDALPFTADTNVISISRVAATPGTITFNAGITANSSITAVGAITGSNLAVTNWNTAYGWGDHGTEGYLTGNESITLSGDLSGSGSTSINASLVSSSVDIAHLSATGTASSSTYLRGDNTWATPAGGGGAPTEDIIMTATKTASQNVNGAEGTETDLTWDDSLHDTGEITSFTNGDSVVQITNAGWINIHASMVILDNTANNRLVLLLMMEHTSSTDVEKYTYYGDAQYNRDDAAGYDSSGGSVSQSMMYVAAGDKLIFRTRVLDDGTAATTTVYPSTTYSKLRIARIEF